LAAAESLSGEGMPGELDSRTVLARAKEGDVDAFHLIFQRYARPIHSFISGFLGSAASSEELTQETFFRAFRRLPTIRNEKQLATWLFGIARNVVREQIRSLYRGNRNVALDEIVHGEIQDGAELPDARLVRAEISAALQKGLHALSEDQRTVFALKIFSQLSYAEISGVTGHSVEKLKTDLHRARAQLRRRLSPFLQADQGDTRG